MHVGPLAPHLSLLHSGEVGKSAGHQNFQPLAHAGDAGAAQGASHGRHIDPVGSRVHSPQILIPKRTLPAPISTTSSPTRSCPGGCAPSTAPSTTWCRAKKISARPSSPSPTAVRIRMLRPGYQHDRPQRCRFRAAHHLQSDRRPDHHQPGGGAGVRRVAASASSLAVSFISCERGWGPRSAGAAGDDADDPQHDAGRGSFGWLQHLVHVLRPVLRPRPRLHPAGHRGRRHPAATDDPIFVGTRMSPTNFMMIERTLKGPDGAATNLTTPFVDQNQTYTSHASHQVFLREYVLDAAGHPVATGELIKGADGGMATWADVKAQARNMLGIELTDFDVGRVPWSSPMRTASSYPAPSGLPQLVAWRDRRWLLASGTPRLRSLPQSPSTPGMRSSSTSRTLPIRAGKIADDDAVTGSPVIRLQMAVSKRTRW